MCRWLVFASLSEIDTRSVICLHPHNIQDMSRHHFLPGILEEALKAAHGDMTKTQLMAKIFKRNHAVNDDGWGLAVYATGDVVPRVMHGIDPIAENKELCMALQTGQFGHARLLFVHARAASHGSVRIENTHPFVVGDFSFMHNGGIAHFRDIRPQMREHIGPELAAQIRGETDTEHCFALFRSFVPPEKRSAGSLSAAELAQALESTILWIISHTDMALGDARTASSMNFAVTDGISIACSRFRDHVTEQPPSLYLGMGSSKLLNIHESASERVVLIASEPLIGEETEEAERQAWTIIPRNSVVAISGQDRLAVDVRPVASYSAYIAAQRLHGHVRHISHNAGTEDHVQQHSTPLEKRDIEG